MSLIMTMKISWAYWKYWSAFSCSTLLIFVFLSNMSSHFLSLTDPPITTPLILNANISYDIRISEARVNRSGVPMLSSNSCEGRRIYMYDLPAKFNSQLLHNCSGKLVSWLDFCRHIENHGFGPSIPNSKGWYATDLYMLEIVFHNRMKRYRCLVSDPTQADAFFIPYYIGLDALRYLYGNDRDRASHHGAELVSWLDQKGMWSWRKRGGTDHFMVTGRTAWDLSRPPTAKGINWGTSLLELPAMANVTALLVESRTWIDREQAVPYLTSFHPNSLRELKSWTEAVVASARREFLFAFVGAPRRGLGIRRAVIEQCRNSSSKCVMVNCAEMKCSHKPDGVMKELLKADFCLQPPGDSPTRRSTFDALIAGCIPVFFRRDSAYEQYTWHLPSDPETYSVFIAEERLVQNPKKALRIEDVLSSYSPEKIRRMREKIVEIIPSLLYMNFAKKSGGENFPKDAFDLSVDGMLRRTMSHRFWNRL